MEELRKNLRALASDALTVLVLVGLFGSVLVGAGLITYHGVNAGFGLAVPLGYMFALTIVPANWNKGDFWPMHPRVLTGTLFACALLIGLILPLLPAR